MGLISTGSASLGAGVGPCGHDTEDEPTEVVTQTLVGAIYFDPLDRVYKRNADLTMVPSSGPIQRASHLMLPRGSIAAVAASGLDIEVIKRASPLRRIRTIEDELRITWKALLDANQIRIGKVTLDPVVGALLRRGHGPDHRRVEAALEHPGA
jgi:hypothetical protein